MSTNTLGDRITPDSDKYRRTDAFCSLKYSLTIKRFSPSGKETILVKVDENINEM